MKEIVLNSAQYLALRADCTETFFVAGIGSGKTFLGGVFIAEMLKIRGARLAVLSPTYEMLKNSTFAGVENAWEQLGFKLGRDYVVNVAPPKAWRVKPYSKQNNTNVVTTRFGSYVVLSQLSNYNKQRGTEYDAIFVDEFREVAEDARLVLLGRLRGRAFKSIGKKSRILYCTTPPDNPTQLRHIRDAAGDELAYIQTTTFSNAKNLPEGYIDRLKSILDETTYQREVLGELIAMNGRPFVVNFNYVKHVTDDQVNTERGVYLSFDFNINPITAIVAIHDGGRYIRIIDEFRLSNTSLADLCAAIHSKYPFVLQVTGDASGLSRNALSGNVTAYQIIMKELKLNSHQIAVTASNPRIQDSFIRTNLVFEKYDIKINSRCKYLIEDVQFVKMTEHNEIDKSDSKRTHLLDCLRYYINTFHYKLN